MTLPTPPRPTPPGQRLLVADSFLQTLLRSNFWRFSSSLRGLMQLVRPVRFDAEVLQPWKDIGRDPLAGAGGWEATGPQPQFLIPCLLPAGWLRVRLQMTCENPGRVSLLTLPGDPAAPVQTLHTLDVKEGYDGEFLVHVDRPSLGLRFEPNNNPGRFRLHTFQVRQAVAPLASLRRWFSSPGAPRPRRSRPRVANDERPDVVYVLLAAGLCGGVRVILNHVSRLAARGWNARLFYIDGDLSWFPGDVPAERFDNVPALKAALAQFRGVKVATWYETAPWVAESLRPGDRGYYMIQDIEESYARTPEQAAAALHTYTLPLQALTEGAWVHKQLESRFRLDPVHVGIGVDLDTFQPDEVERDPLRILTQARTWSGGGDEVGDRLKGWATARAAVLRCHELNPFTRLTTYSIEPPPSFPSDLPHEHVQGPTDMELAGLYQRAGMFLLTSNHEGFGLTAAEAMACGCPVVATRADGNEEFCIDGVTALTAPAGDVEQLAQLCLRVQADPVLAAELSRQGQQFIREYTWDRVVDELENEFRDRPAGVIRANRGRPLPQIPEIPIAKRTVKPWRALTEHPRLNLPAPTVDCTLVIPTVNDVQQVARCVSTCREFAPAGAKLQFVVVDDGSADPTILEQLEQASRELDFELLANHQNLGFSATVNHGLRHARGRYVLLCNNDIVFDQPWLEVVERAFAQDRHVGVVGARLRYPDGRLQHAAMDKIAGTLRFHHTHAGKPGDHPPALEQRYAWSVTGALLALRRETLQRLGGLSTAYTLSYEDVDYCLLAWSEGIRVLYCPDWTAQHLEGSTRGNTPSRKFTRSVLWSERERNSEAYFDRKWAALRYVESLDDFLALSDEHPLMPPEAPAEGQAESQPAREALAS